MPRRRSRCSSAALLAVLLAVAAPRVARAQACCAGTGAVTPARLALHEDALVGVGLRTTDGLGSFSTTGAYVGAPAGASELDLEQDVMGALRVRDRAQVAVLVPLVETHRTAGPASESGGGVGDVNASVRYDFIYAGEARRVPGVAVLAGVTFPTGTPPESATKPLATDATGVGAFQANVGVSVEKAFGPWLVGATGLVAKRAARDIQGVHDTLAAQWTALVVGAYTFPSEAAIALSGAFTAEGDATIDGMVEPGSHRRLFALSVSGVLPLSDRLRVQGAITYDPPVSSFGVNEPVAGLGAAATVIYAWL